MSYEQLDKHVAEIYKKTLVAERQQATVKRIPSLEEQMLNSLNNMLRKTLQLEQDPNIPLAKIEELKTSFSKTLHLFAMYTHPDVIDQLVYEELKKKNLAKMESKS